MGRRTKALAALVILTAVVASAGISQAHTASKSSGQRQTAAIEPSSNDKAVPGRLAAPMSVKDALHGKYDTRLIDRHLAGLPERGRAKFDRSDFKVTKQRAGETVVVRVGPKGSPAPAPLRSVKVGDSYRVAFGAGRANPPAPKSPRPREGNIEWYEPYCKFDNGAERWYVYAEIDGKLEYVGWVDGCSQWGSITYPSQTKEHWGFQMNSTCLADRFEDKYYSVYTQCGVETRIDPASAPFGWDSWDPPNDAVTGCQSYPATITAGAFSGTVPLDLCQTVKIVKGPIAPYFKSSWEGPETYNEHRNAASVIAINNDFGADISLLPYFTVTYRLLPIVPHKADRPRVH